MNQKLNWNKNLMNKLLGFFGDLGLSESQSLRLIDEIDKSIIWNNQIFYYDDTDEVLLDGPLDDKTCIKCLLEMKSGLKIVADLKHNDQWENSLHPNCRCNYSYETKSTMNKQQKIHHLIEKFLEDNHF